MKIGIVGAGRMGHELGRRWARAGHAVTVSFSRDQRKIERIALDIGQLAYEQELGETLGYRIVLPGST